MMMLPKILAYLLLPFSWVFQFACFLRYHYYRFKNKNLRLSVPVIIVGNLSMGGTGKTPLVAWLVEQLSKQGFYPAVVTRGYKGSLPAHSVVKVNAESESREVGDEPLLLAKKLSCPIIVSKKRLNGAKWLMAQDPKVNLIICDDGLQHYALPRTLEIALIDGEKRLGNGFCLPAGPLRESPRRLKRVDFIVCNGKARQDEWEMTTTLSNRIYQLNQPEFKKDLSSLAGQPVHALAGIGNPDRFFNQLRERGIAVIGHRFADHFYFKPSDLQFDDNLPILMTEKDAVKCQSFNLSNAWCVPLEVALPEGFLPMLLKRLKDG